MDPPARLACTLRNWHPQAGQRIAAPTAGRDHTTRPCRLWQGRTAPLPRISYIGRSVVGARRGSVRGQRVLNVPGPIVHLLSTAAQQTCCAKLPHAGGSRITTCSYSVQDLAGGTQGWVATMAVVGDLSFLPSPTSPIVYLTILEKRSWTLQAKEKKEVHWHCGSAGHLIRAAGSH